MVLTLNRDMDDETVKYWIRHSIKEVLKKLPKKNTIGIFGRLSAINGFLWLMCHYYSIILLRLTILFRFHPYMLLEHCRKMA